MKPPVIVASLTFHRYPDEKPEKAGTYWCKYDNNYGLVYYDIDFGFDFNPTGNPMLTRNNRTVFAFAELPTVDLDSEEFDFSTALELMKEGIKCLSESLNTWKIENGTFWKATNTGWVTDLPYHNEILGKWRLAE